MIALNLLLIWLATPGFFFVVLACYFFVSTLHSPMVSWPVLSFVGLVLGILTIPTACNLYFDSFDSTPAGTLAAPVRLLSAVLVSGLRSCVQLLV